MDSIYEWNHPGAVTPGSDTENRAEWGLNLKMSGMGG